MRWLNMEEAVASEGVRILGVADPAMEGYREVAMHELASEPFTLDLLPWEAYRAAMQDSLYGDGVDPYDIVMVPGHLWLRDLVEDGVLASLGLPAGNPEGVFPTLCSDLSYRGQRYVVPCFHDGHIVVWRKDFVRTPFPDRLTPEEYIECLAAEYAAGRRQFLAIKAHPSEIFTDALPFLRMAQEDVYGTDGKPLWDTRASAEGLSAYCALRKYALCGTETFGNEAVMDALLGGKAGVAITWSGQLACLGKRAEAFGYSTLSTAWRAVWSFGINARSRRKEACLSLLRSFGTEAADRIIYPYSGTPLHEAVFEEATLPWKNAVRRMVAEARALPFLRFSEEKNGALGRAAGRAFSEGESPEDALREAAQEIRAIAPDKAYA